MPKLVMKSVTTPHVKNKLREICGSEDNFQELEGLDWGFVKGDYGYNGDLDLSQQIAFLELELGRISTEYEEDEQGFEVEGAEREDIEFFLARIAELVFQREIRELLISEAEEIAWE